MRRLTVLLAALLAFGAGMAPALASAQIMPTGVFCPGVAGPLVAYAHEQVTVGATAVALTASTYIASGTVPVAALLVVLTNPVNALDDGTTATASLGAVLNAASTTLPGLYWVCGRSIGALSLIRNGGSNATVNVIFYRAN